MTQNGFVEALLRVAEAWFPIKAIEACSYLPPETLAILANDKFKPVIKDTHP